MVTARNDHTYVKRRDALRRRAYKADAPCHLCGRPIDWDAHYLDPWAFTADHEDAVAAGGSMHGKLLPAHRRCNSSRGKRTIDEYVDRAPQAVTPTVTW